MRSLLVKDTTREERERIVAECLQDAEVSCEDSLSDADMALYAPYIEGKCELREVTRGFSAKYVKESMEAPVDTGCGMGR